MNMYMWTSNCFKQYGLGRIIVMAETAEEAREKAKARVRWAALDPAWEGARFFGNYMGTENFDVEELEHYSNKMQMFDQDVSTEPELVSEHCLFIPGSE